MPGAEKEYKDPVRLKELLDYLETTDLEFVHLEKDGKKLTLRRSCDGMELRSGADAEAAEADSEPKGPLTQSIRSPIVGRFHSSMGADRPPLVVEGGRVTAGQKVAIVEAMKIKKEVFSAYTGRIVRIAVRDNDSVEYGQELFVVEPEEKSA